MLKNLVKKEFTRGEYISTEEIVNLIKDDNAILTKIMDGLYKADSTAEEREETLKLIKGRILGKTAHYGYSEETNQSCMVIHTFDILSALMMHLVCYDRIEELRKVAAELEKTGDLAELNGVFDSVSTAIVEVFQKEESVEKYISYMLQVFNQLFSSNENISEEVSLENRYSSMDNKNLRFIDNILAAVKTSVISQLSSEQPELPIDITQDVFPDYVSHILIADTLFGGVHILEIGG